VDQLQRRSVTRRLGVGKGIGRNNRYHGRSCNNVIIWGGCVEVMWTTFSPIRYLKLLLLKYH